MKRAANFVKVQMWALTISMGPPGKHLFSGNPPFLLQIYYGNVAISSVGL